MTALVALSAGALLLLAMVAVAVTFCRGLARLDAGTENVQPYQPIDTTPRTDGAHL